MSSFYDGSGVGSYGAGDAQSMYNSTSAQYLAVTDGTAASPDTSLNPLVKVERTINIAEAAIGGDGVEQLSSIVGITVGTAACEVQPVGVAGLAKTSSTVSAPGNDACGLYGVGRVTGSGTGVGIGLFALGRSESSTGKITGAEVDVHNATGSDHSVNTTGFNNSQAMWVNSVGANRAGVGIAMGNPLGSQFDVGVHFNGQVFGGKTGPTLTNDIRSDSNSTTGVLIKGTHSVAGIAVGSGSGKVLIGGEASVQANSKLEVLATASTNPIAYFGTTTGNVVVAIQGQSGYHNFAVSNGSNQFLTGDVAGDLCIFPSTASKSVHLGGTASVIKVAIGNTLGFFQATPVAKQTVTGSRGANAALASLLTALASFGLITDSSSA